MNIIFFGFAAFEEVGSLEVKRFGWEVLEDWPLGLIFCASFVLCLAVVIPTATSSWDDPFSSELLLGFL